MFKNVTRSQKDPLCLRSKTEFSKTLAATLQECAQITQNCSFFFIVSIREKHIFRETFPRFGKWSKKRNCKEFRQSRSLISLNVQLELPLFINVARIIQSLPFAGEVKVIFQLFRDEPTFMVNKYIDFNSQNYFKKTESMANESGSSRMGPRWLSHMKSQHNHLYPFGS